MVLRHRLDTLRRQAGAATVEPGPTRDGGATTLQERLARMRVGRGNQATAAPGSGDPAALAQALGAEVVSPGVLRVDHDLADGERHGAARVPGPEAHLVFPGMPELPLTAAGFLDTETSGLAGGTGTIAFNVGLLRRRGDRWQARQYLLTGFRGEAAMLDALAEDLQGLEAVVTYNGGSFDLPLLRDRYRLNGVSTPPLPQRHVDLLHPVRRLFARRWPDCRLATVEARLLGMQRDNDLPGSAVPGVWFDWVHRGHGHLLDDVLRHNRLDILSLLALAPQIGNVAACPWEWSADSRGAAAAWLRAGDEGHALECLQRGQDLDAAGRLELARLLRRQWRLDEAVAIWQALAREGDTRGAEHLAKFYEHVQRDPVAARRWADSLPSGPDKERRLARLRGRGASGANLSLELGAPARRR